jgi:hypothetical protein
MVALSDQGIVFINDGSVVGVVLHEPLLPVSDE